MAILVKKKRKYITRHYIIIYIILDWASPGSSEGTESACKEGDLCSVSGVGRSLVFLPEESHGQRSLAGYSAWGHKEFDKTEQLITAQHIDE